ncbi:DUF3685 domain-containing protein [Anabaena sp. FACHB-1237]|uniref:DUF3685 domain-containing protein n=1 Tax=Anabaena sp. FACHB-1237 TaxID=2692769 RepID=UPI0016805997|nr:DUF3685 domain-containing protein [Anabaena sp. FACHB-1237]MBD2138392.1 DUF3685 domain-containing protein [Anabaena sp. FACHB-1237]
MSDRQLHFLLIDSDSIFRLGLKVTLESIPDFQVIADVPTITTAGQILAEITSTSQPINLIIWELGNTAKSIQLDLQLCQQLKVLYPHIPILLLTTISQPELLTQAQTIGINGYCPKGISISELIPIIQEVANGGYYWFYPVENTISSSFYLPFAKFRYHLGKSGINKINKTLETVNNELNIPGIAPLDKAILAGQKRELLAARWLINHLLITHPKKQERSLNQPLAQNISAAQSHITNLVNIPPINNSIIDAQSRQTQLFHLCLTQLQFPLHNLTTIPLEIDCLQEDKKRQLLQIILHKLFQKLTEVRNFNFDYQQLTQLREQLLLDLLTTAICDFFTEYKIIIYTIKLENFLLEKSINVAQEILYKIPLVTELIAYIVLGKDLYIDNRYYLANSQESQLKAMIILENLIIQVANGVIQPLLNYFADVEIIKQNFYISAMVSTREIEKFRNNLSWKYSKNQYINEPQAIFESRYELFNFTSRGITKISVYAPRNQELAQISGIPLMVTLLLEFADAINPRLQSLLSFLGSGIVFILTQVVGKGLGLIGRGIIQGLGNVSLLDKK